MTLFRCLSKVDIHKEEDLLPPGAPAGTIATDLNQSTGLERMEILAKMQGVDLWDLKPLDSTRLGTMEDPIIVKADGPEQYVGCTGYPVDSHWVRWLTLSEKRPIERCDQCGNVIKLELLRPEAHDDSMLNACICLLTCLETNSFRWT